MAFRDDKALAKLISLQLDSYIQGRITAPALVAAFRELACRYKPDTVAELFLQQYHERVGKTTRAKAELMLQLMYYIQSQAHTPSPLTEPTYTLREPGSLRYPPRANNPIWDSPTYNLDEPLIPTESEKNNKSSAEKYDDNIPAIDYKALSLDLDSAGDHKMRGIDYLNPAIKQYPAYAHMRAMLLDCWKQQGIDTSNKANFPFMPDERFSFSIEQIREYLKSHFNVQTIDDAHANVWATYDARTGRRKPGKPFGSSNRSRVTPQPTPAPIHDPLIDVLEPEDVKPSTALVPVNGGSPQPNVDLSEYARIDWVADTFLTKLTARDDYAQKADVMSLIMPLQAEIKRLQEAQGRVITLERNSMPAINLGLQHMNFPKLLKACNANLRGGNRMNVWLFGPPGAGKTTAAKYVSEALTPGRFYAMPALETGFQVLGYKDGSGQYVSTLFRQCWEFGGTIILDEVDSYSPSAALALNGALANGICSFPDKMVPRHPECIIIAGANTTGLGGTMEFVGRLKQDAAFLDRYVPLAWPHDDILEDGLVADKRWLQIVRQVRSNVARQQVKGVMVTMRASIFGEALLAAGLDLEDVKHMALKKGMTDAQWNQVKV